ncbi:transglutaminase-like putative cysteine protease [Allocatelliglobosispora scoriae]|uniref:Transglutaminase-like putative cysteine protease n=1 Tax=Allocatelliglobosispora scoriae TaxID=643052 RepID=A0A841BLT7_9ACTN|nr:transglutaminase domain-containing protein [Allocatelliglobosispora scoriae]MBB5868615.1 transglutaminase-like putative cysteine protease [Allocatelliglobosispora scoriae]
MRQRWTLVTTLLTVAIGGALFFPVFTIAVVVLPIGVVLGAVLITDELVSARRALAAWRPLVAGLLGTGGLLALVSLRHGTERTPSALSAALRDALVDGWRRVLDFTWPVRPDPAAILFLGLVLLLASLVAAELLRHHRPLAAQLPGLAVMLFAQVYVAALGLAAIAAGLAYCLLAGVTVLRAERRSPAGPVAPQRSPARPLLMTMTAVVAATVVAGTAFASADPYSLRDDYQAARHPATAANPLDQLGDRLTSPDQEVFDYRADAATDRWAQVVLDAFDGSRWSTSGELRWLGAPVDGAAAGRRTASVRITGLDGPWLPAPGVVVEVTGVQPMVSASTGTLVAESGVGGATYQVAWRDLLITPTSIADSTGVITGPEALTPPGIPPALQEIAVEAVGPLRGVAAARALQTYLRTHNQLATGKDLPTGHGYAQLEHFLTRSHRGTSEQFATAYAVLARAVGLPTRLVVGFRAPAQAEGDGGYVVRNADALAWPQVRVAGVGWVGFDPTPETGAKPTTKPAEPEVEPSLDAALPPVETPAPVASPEATGSAGDGPRFCFSCLGVALGGVLLGGGLAWPLSTLIRKRLRARRRRSGDSRAMVVGAWHEVRDGFTDHGVGQVRGLTPRDLSRRPDGLLDAEASAELDKLRAALDRACWSVEPVPPGLGDQAWQAAGAVLRRLSRGVRLRRRLRAALSTASLRYRSDGGA